MDFCILGPLQALDEGRVVTPRGTKQRALLALLVLHANETVSTDRLIDELWGEHPPATAVKTLQVHVSHLRKTLARGSDNGADGIIVTRYHGYELQLEPERLDSYQFEALAGEGRAELAQGRPARAASALERALALWTGPPLADVAYEPFAQREIARLADLRTAALEQLVEAQLELGRHEEVVPQLEALIREHPYRERLRAQLMLALYRCDRQADALQAYHDARRSLVDGLGIEPGERLRELEHAILAQDPTLTVPATDAPDVPPELASGTLLAGREAELEWLREHWRGAKRGAGRLLLVAGARGMGKTRLAAELARDVERERGDVLYLDGKSPPETVRVALEGARTAGRPTLLVVEDADRAGEEQLAALDELVVALAGLPLLVLATAESSAVGTRMRAAATLELPPLDRDGVLAVARLYAANRDPMEIPLEQLAEASGRIPQRVHRLASEWARAQAARRLGAVAARAASERTGLRTAEDDVAASVVELQALRARSGLEDAERVFVACPFKGLASFELEDAEVFFGRERLVAEMVARLTGAPLMGIVGPSGSGKSSALRAGLLAALADGVLPGSGDWGLALLRPGEHPLTALEQATAEVASRDRLVIAVDQFEETFATCRDEAERVAFINALVTHARDPRRRALVLMAVRADLYGRCAAHPELSRMLGANHVLVGPMRHSELRRAIELPARRAGLRVEPDLVDALVADVEGEPGALPLLSTSLLELWERRDGRTLRMSAYEHAGGVHGAVARLAESAYERLDSDRQLLARRLLLRLAGEGETAVRRRVPLAELGGGRDQRVTEVLDRLAEERLVTIGDGEVEIAHEALLREWPRLRGWLEEDAEGRRLQLRLAAAARQWQAAGRDSEELYRGPRLAAALDWSAGHRGELNPVERAFLDESRAAGERSQRRLHVALAGVLGLLILALIAGVVALDERGNARDEAIAADAQRLGAQALSEDDLDRALLLARQGVALDDTPQTRGNLLAALLKSPAAVGVLRGDGDQLISMDLSPDERTLAFIDYDGTVTFVDTRTRRRTGRPAAVAGSVADGVIVDADLRPDVRFSPDGSLVAVAGSSPVVLDARTHRVLARLRIGTGRIMYTVRFSPSGRALSAAIAIGQAGGTVIRRFDVRSGRPLGAERQVSRGPVTLMLSRDGRRMITTGLGQDTLVSDARTLRPLERLPIGAGQAALSPNDRTMLAGGRDGSVRFVNMATGDARRASGRHDGAVVESEFSADGRTAITAGEDGRLIAWDVGRASAGETLEGQGGQITGLAISRDSSTLYTTGLDGKVLIWDLAGSRRLGRPFKAGRSNPEFPRFALSSDGRLLALGQLDGTVELVDARTLRAVSAFRVTRGPVRGIGFVPRGRLLVVGGDDGFLALVDPGRGRIVRRLGGHNERILTPSFSADGRLMATASDVQGDPADGEVRLWALPSGMPVGAPLRYPAVGDVSLSPDGRTLAVTHPPAGGVEIVDVAKRDARASLSGAETIWGLARFTPDGRYLVGGSYKGWARLWSAEEPGPFNLASPWKPASPPFSGHAGRVEWQSVSPDSRTLATGSTDGTIRLWDLRAQEPLGTPLPGLPNRYLLPQFTPDGAHLFAITDAGRAYRWDVRPSSWARHACAVAGRRLTRSEWKDALPGRDYDPAC